MRSRVNTTGSRRRFAHIIYGAAALVLAAGMAPVSAGGPKDGDLFFFFQGIKVRAINAAVLTEPSDTITLKYFTSEKGKTVKAVKCRGGNFCKPRGDSFTISTPERSGNYTMTVDLDVLPASAAKQKAGLREKVTAKLTVLVGFPRSLLKDGFINGFEIGEYPSKDNAKNPEHYLPPKYFHYLDNKVMGAWISEHFRLGDLGYDGRAPLPQYFALRMDLAKKLEAMVAELERRQLPSRVHFIGGGFISPKSNMKRTASNSGAASMSRHMWGEAVDFIIDEKPRDEVMDDLNGDGRIDVRDAFVVRDLLTDLEESGKVVPGGIGVYAPPKDHQIQLHVDVRGYQSRWGVKEWNPEVYGQAPPVRSRRPGG